MMKWIEKEHTFRITRSNQTLDDFIFELWVNSQTGFHHGYN